MIESLLPPAAVGVEAFADLPGEPVFPGEEDLVATAVPGRRREFVTGRRCAREALEQLGVPPAPIRRGESRDPLWPPGVIGSITHCAGYRAAAVARRADMAALGIDAEPHEPLPDGVEATVTVPGELAGLADPAVHWGRLLFSAKESIYKAWYPLCARWLGFDEVRLAINPATRTFTGHLLVDGTRLDGEPPLTELRGRYLIARGLILTTVTVPIV
ncbi:4'-phosphopantetheinyl transferase family protein [Actinoplanes subtropicus]|uniref:4'-phosphopantetheinyl transferase family protein n=1 Tax=Actinoplanes subtropicus TaxID=543632 RepID=UPI0004C331DB|nr:4'-phosphopantetheinyl transferase superfamily protein [Actinoplanes subtropicus]